MFTDKFFDNVIVNDTNNDIKNNRLELLKMFCNTFNNFINFSKLEGVSWSNLFLVSMIKR